MSDLNAFQKAVLRHCRGSEAADITHFHEVEDFGDPTLTGLIQELDSHEDCHTVEEARRRIDRVMEMVTDAFFAIEAVADGQDTTKPGRSSRTFYRHCFLFEVLSEEPVGQWDLSDYHYQTTEGCCVGRFIFSNERYLGGHQAAVALEAAGSDAGFFNLTPDGSDDEI